MSSRKPPPLAPAPPPTVLEEIRRRFPARLVQTMETVFELRATAQQVDNVLTEWFEDTAGSPARFEILMLLWAAKGGTVPHKEIVARLGVTRATVSGLMAALEREGFVRSSTDRDDRRQLLATLTSRGEAVIGKAIDVNVTRLRAVFQSWSATELKTFTALCHRVREGFAADANGLRAKIAGRPGQPVPAGRQDE